MKGHNTLIINQATLIEMAQEWLDKRYLNDSYMKLTVISVKPNSENSIDKSLGVEISLESKEILVEKDAN